MQRWRRGGDKRPRGMAAPQLQTMCMFRNCLRTLKCLTRYICPSRYIRLLIYSCENGSRAECSDGVRGAAPALRSSPHTADTHGKKKHLRPVSLTGNLASGFLFNRWQSTSHAQIKAAWMEGGWKVWIKAHRRTHMSLFMLVLMQQQGGCSVMLCCQSLHQLQSRTDLHIPPDCPKCGKVCGQCGKSFFMETPI